MTPVQPAQPQASAPAAVSDQWDTSVLDLDAYLASVGAQAAPPSRSNLDALIRAHVARFPFTNIQVLLGTHPGVDLAAVQRTFVTRGLGGYCFEHATLFHAVLDRLGYVATPHLGRVGTAASPRTHLVVVVDLDGQRFLCDPGIGIPPLGAIPLQAEATLDAGLWPHRIQRGDEGRAGTSWQLWRQRAGSWEFMHATDELPVRPIDAALAHHWTSTAPRSPFRSAFMFNRHQMRPDGSRFVRTITADVVTEGGPSGEPQRRVFDVDELGSLLAASDTVLEADELAQLAEIVRRFRHGSGV